MKNEKWWQGAGLGMMVHFGVYSVLAGEYKGQSHPYCAEWIMPELRIPIKEYDEVAKTFNPVKFNADEWIKTAAEAGVRYIVFTTKHHEGFCNFKTDVSDYSLWNYQNRDIVLELRDACKKYGVRLGLYYSHCLDWHEKHGGGAMKDPKECLDISPYNDWDFPDKSDYDFDKYLNEKSYPQVKELMDNYKPDILWFDCCWGITKDNAKKFYEIVKEGNPHCMTNSRLCELTNEYHDYRGMGDNQVAGKPTEDTTESIITLNGTWGYNKADNNWKSVEQVVKTWMKCASVNANLSINVGPKGDGSWPVETVDIFKGLAKWNKVNGEALHDVDAVNAPINCDDYVVTRKDNSLYLCFLENVKDAEIVCLKSKIKSASVLGDLYNVDIKQEYENNIFVTKINCDKDNKLSVVKLDFEGEIEFCQDLIERNNQIELKPLDGTLFAKNNENRINDSGIVVDWYDTDDYITWDFYMRNRGEYKVTLITSAIEFYGEWKGGHKVFITLNDTKYPLYEVINDGDILEAGEVWKQAKTELGTVFVDKIGKNTLKIKADFIKEKTPGFGLVMLKLQREF